MAILEPQLAVLDETDSGLDIDALRIVAGGVNALRGPARAMLVITHYQRLLDYIVPDVVHVLAGGRIVELGGKELALELEEKGYGWVERGGRAELAERRTRWPLAPAALRGANAALADRARSRAARERARALRGARASRTRGRGVALHERRAAGAGVRAGERPGARPAPTSRLSPGPVRAARLRS